MKKQKPLYNDFLDKCSTVESWPSVPCQTIDNSAQNNQIETIKSLKFQLNNAKEEIEDLKKKNKLLKSLLDEKRSV